jgi:hypothetical protein
MLVPDGNARDLFRGQWFSFFNSSHASRDISLSLSLSLSVSLSGLAFHILTVAVRKKLLSLFMDEMGPINSTVWKHNAVTCASSLRQKSTCLR